MFFGVRPGTPRIPPAPHIKDERVVDSLPPLTDEQREVLALIFRSNCDKRS